MPKKHENIMGYILPAIRALIAKELLETHKLKQEDVAKKLGVTQPAVSQYKREVRGSNFEIFAQDPKIMNFIHSITKDIVENQIVDVKFDLSVNYKVVATKQHELNLKIDPKSKEYEIK